MRSKKGVTLVELLVAMTIMMIVAAAFSGMLKYSLQATVRAQTQGEAQEEARQALMRLEAALIHANEITIASSALVEFVCDIEASPLYDSDGDIDSDGIPNYRDSDTQLLAPATAQWRVGYNLKDEEEDGDGRVDIRRRLYLSSGTLYLDASLNEEPWGERVESLPVKASSFTLTYWGNKASPLGRRIDLGQDGLAATADPGENDGIIAAAEMDMAAPPSGMGNRNGALDSAGERRYITSIRIRLGSDHNRDGRADYAVETDVYPPLLPLKKR